MIVKGNRTIQLEVAVHIHTCIYTVNHCNHDSLVPIIRYHLVIEGQAVNRTSEYLTFNVVGLPFPFVMCESVRVAARPIPGIERWQGVLKSLSPNVGEEMFLKGIKETRVRLVTVRSVSIKLYIYRSHVT